MQCLPSCYAAVSNFQLALQMLLRGANAVGYTTYADNVVRAFVQESVRQCMQCMHLSRSRLF